MAATALAVVDKTIQKAQPRFNAIAKAGGGFVDFETEARYASQIIKRSASLMRCETHSIEEAVYNIAGIGLSLNPALGHAALIPRKAGDNKTYCHFDPMYRGLIKLATDGGTIKAIQAAAVYEEEIHAGNFKMTRGTDPQVIHNVDPLMKLEAMGEIVGAYCVAEIAGSGMKHTTWMPIDEIQTIRDRSQAWKAKKKGPWATDFQEMCVKTVIKRARKQWPMGNERLDRAIQLANQAEGYIEPSDDDIIGEATAVNTITKDLAVELRKLCKLAHMRVARVYDRYKIQKMELLPADKFNECQVLLRQAVAHYDTKHAEKGTVLYAADYGLDLKQLEGIAAIQESVASLRAKRKQ